METDVIKALKEIIRKHTVRYEVWSHFEISEGKRVMVGFDIELYGTHDHGATVFPPAAICALRPTTICNASQSTFFRKTNGRRNTRFRLLTSHYMLHGEDRSK